MLVLLRWIWNYPKRKRPSMIADIDEHARHANVIRCRSASGRNSSGGEHHSSVTAGGPEAVTITSSDEPGWLPRPLRFTRSMIASDRLRLSVNWDIDF
jgi:hypothetical protein